MSISSMIMEHKTASLFQSCHRHVGDLHVQDRDRNRREWKGVHRGMLHHSHSRFILGGKYGNPQNRASSQSQLDEEAMTFAAQRIFASRSTSSSFCEYSTIHSKQHLFAAAIVREKEVHAWSSFHVGHGQVCTHFEHVWHAIPHPRFHSPQP